MFRLYELREKLKEAESDVAREKQEIEMQHIAKELLARRRDAACMIQRNWRAFLARKALAAKRKAAQAKAKKAADAAKKGGKGGKGGKATNDKGKSPPKRAPPSAKSTAKK